MKTLIKNEILKMSKSFILYIVLFFVILMAFDAYWMPYSSLTQILVQLVHISKAQKVSLTTLLSSQSSTINDIMHIYASNSIIDYMLYTFYPLIIMVAPFLISTSIGSEYTLKTIRVLTSHESRMNVFFSKLFFNFFLLITLLFVFIASGIFFCYIFKTKATEALNQYAPSFQTAPLSFNFISKIPIQLILIFLIVAAVLSMITLFNILTKNTIIGSVISIVYLYFEGSFLNIVHLGSISLNINALSVTAKFFHYFEEGVVQNFVLKQIYRGQPLMFAVFIILMYIIVPTCTSYLLFKKEDL